MPPATCYGAWVPSKCSWEVGIPFCPALTWRMTTLPWVQHDKNTGAPITFIPSSCVKRRFHSGRGKPNRSYSSTPLCQAPALKAGVLLREKYAIAPSPTFRVLAQMFCPVEEVVHKNKSLESHPKDADFICNSTWASSILRASSK